tara:strand:+ start:310 stop:504 length:195 start_codon:yes stop_codon:yes gene_type:complete
MKVSNRKKFIIDINSIYEQDERLVKVLRKNPELEKKWLHKMVKDGWIGIIDFWEEEEFEKGATQ